MEEHIAPSSGSLQDLQGALFDALESNGKMAKLRSRVRAEVFRSIEQTDYTTAPPPLPSDNVLINELIREYLDYNGYSHASSVLLTESGQPNEQLDRNFIADELGVTPGGGLPMLYGLVSTYQQWKKDREHAQGVGDSQAVYDGPDAVRATVAEGRSELLDGVEDPAPIVFHK